MTFEQLNLSAPILRALQSEGYEKPTPIQEKAIPVVLSGRDLFGIAQTGTGKTAAFSLPILQDLTENPKAHHSGFRPIRALICTPTRELAIQIDESLAAYGKFLNIRHTVVFGGVKLGGQITALKDGVDILVATPGRLLDLMNQGYISLKHIEKFVLDEADRMLDMGFIHDIRRIISKLPLKRQSLFFSATMPPDILELASKILTNPATVEVTPAASTVDRIEQSVYMVEKGQKKGLLVKLLQDPAIRSVLVFTRTKHGANKVTQDLNKAGVEAEAIHGNKSQSARQKALSNFKSGATRVLVATDIAARGIDVDELSHVINFELPNIPETYVHRIGRTGRAGNSGIAISFCDQEERAYLKDIQKLIGKAVPVAQANNLPEPTADDSRVGEVKALAAKKPAQPANGNPRPQAAKNRAPQGSSPNRQQNQPRREDARQPENGRRFEKNSSSPDRSRNEARPQSRDTKIKTKPVGWRFRD